MAERARGRTRGPLAACLALTMLMGLALPWSGLLAQEAPRAPLVAVVDVQRVMRESTAVKTLNEYIESLRNTYQEELRQKESELREANQTLVRQRSVLSSDVFAQRRGELEQDVASLQREAQTRKRSIDQLFSKGMSQVQDAISKVTSDVASARGIDVVLNGAAVIISKSEYDITDDVIAGLNESLAQVQLPALQN